MLETQLFLLYPGYVQPWEEESMRDAEKRETLVLLQNLDPTYTSDEVEVLASMKSLFRIVLRDSLINAYLVQLFPDLLHGNLSSFRFICYL